MCAAMACQIIQLVVSIRQRKALRDSTGDPWQGKSLEWTTPSPPPVFNFALLPDLRADKDQKRDFDAIEMPRNSATGFVTGFFATVTGFALIWHIWWLVILGLVAAYAVFVRFAWRDREHYEIPADEVARIAQS
jgi:cytochrome o ubiquinol oxidase subunit I